MEVRASYALVGGFVLAVLAALAVALIWLAKIEVDRSVATYEVAFTGTVNGLQEGSPVRFRGVPVGRVSAIRIDTANISQVLVRLELRPDTPVRTDTVATVEPQGITGIAMIQLTGGTQGAAMPADDGAGHPPRLIAGRSAIEEVFSSTPVVLDRVAAVLERVGLLLSDDNLQNVTATLGDLAKLTDKLAESEPQVRSLLASVTMASEQMRTTGEQFAVLANDLHGTLGGVDGRLDALSDQGRATLAETTAAATAFRDLATRLDRLVRDNAQPVGDFSQGTLYEIRQLVGEMRQLVASGSRISKEFERDPAGYLLGGKQKGFQPP